jgi:hypothetical protein
MKKLLLLVLLIGCKNGKQEILEKQKMLQEKIIFMTLKANQFDHKVVNFISRKNHALTMPEMDTLNTLRDSARQYEYNAAGLRRELDSLERKLKKY